MSRSSSYVLTSETLLSFKVVICMTFIRMLKRKGYEIAQAREMVISQNAARGL